jgi:NhaA family Na+:H+ antiporter
MQDKKPAVASISTSLSKFIQLEYASGLVLFAGVLIAIAWANSPFLEQYHHLWELDLPVGWNDFKLSLSLHEWINDGLMALFFFVIGLELKREFLEGELSTVKNALLPMSAALGGMVVPALIYFAINRNADSAGGWGIPMATDIAFALALLSMAGKHIPISIKVFLSALAVADDLGAVLVIAFFYTSHINFAMLGLGIGILLILLLGNKAGMKSSYFYLLLGLLVWLCFLLSGVHATIAGVLVAFTVPATTKSGYSPLKMMEHSLHPWIAFFIMPVFALANSGIVIGSGFLSNIINPVSIGVTLGLVVGKFLGICSFTWVMIKLKFGVLPANSTWKQIAGVALLGGVGFTMSLFISGLAFDDQTHIEQAKYGILIASLIAGVSGILVLRKRQL